MKKKNIFINLILLLLLTNIIFAEQITKTYYFDEPVLIQDSIYTRIAIEDGIVTGTPGYPALPYKGIMTLLPQNENISEIIIETGNQISLGTYLVYPIQRPVPISDTTGIGFTEPDPDIYGSSEQFPVEQNTKFSTHYLSGYSIGCFTITPISYIPNSGELTYFESITVIIETEYSYSAEDAADNFLFDNNPAVETRLQILVENYEDKDEFYSSTRTRPYSAYDYIIITSEEYEDDFQPLADFHEKRGYRTKIELIDNILSSYNGVDNAEKLRNYFIDEYDQNQNAFQYVLLGGDTDIIPCRGLFGEVVTGPSTSMIDYYIPSDMYFSCLDGSWDEDGDGIWGEAGGDGQLEEADFLAEFYIGRICVNNSTEIANQINKIQKYLEDPVESEIETTLLVGENLWPGIYGGTYMDELLVGSSSNGYTTVGIPVSWTVTKLYEINYNWTPNDLYNELSLGPNLLNHLGHGSPTHCLNIDNGDLTTSNIQNWGNEYNFINGYSQACYSGSMDNRDKFGNYGPDCFAEKITTMPTATSTFIANSRYGWGDPEGTDGASQVFNRYWVDTFFNDNILSIAAANQLSKEKVSEYIANSDVLRWCCYELNVFGDPSLQLWTESPTFIEACYNQFLVIGQQSFDVISYNCSAGRVAIHFEDEIIGVAELLDGYAHVMIFDPPTEEGAATLSILPYNQNYYLYESEIPVIDSPLCISGYIYDNTYYNGIPNIKMNVENGMSVWTNSSGYYCIEVAPGWSGTVTPEKGYWQFDPLYKVYNNIQNNYLNDNYTGIIREGIAGTIILSGGSGQAQDARVTAGGQVVYPNTQGNYVIPLPSNEIVDVYAYLSGYIPEGVNNLEIVENQVQFRDFTLEEGLGIFVQLDGGGDTTTLQEGIDLADDGETVWIADGIYTINDSDISLNGRNLTIESMFTYEDCIINGNQSYNFLIGDRDNSTIVGLTLNNFNKIVIDGSSTSTIKDCIISTRSRIHISDESNIEINNCKISSNSVGIVLESGHTIINKCEITNCIKALEISDFSTAIFEECIISNNEVCPEDDTIIEINGSLTTTFSNCQIVNNSIAGYSSDSKTIFCTGEYSELILLNCTLYGSDVQDNGYSIYLNDGASAAVTNCILWDDVTEQQIYPLYNVDVSYCDIKTDYQGLYPDNCIFIDPQFTDPDNGDYSLDWNNTVRSPCIDTGDPDAEWDEDDTPPDMGAIPAVSHDYDCRTLKEGWNWFSFPVLDTVSIEGTDALTVLEPILDPEILTSVKGNVNGDEYEIYWFIDHWVVPVELETFRSIDGYKIKMNSDAELPISGFLEDPDIVFLLEAEHENWIGYFLPYSQTPEDAFASIWNNLTFIKADFWGLIRIGDEIYKGKGDPSVDYGKLYIVGVAMDCIFTWGDWHHPKQPYERTMPELFTYEEQADYMPIFVDSTEALNGIDEIGVFLGDKCIGASVVEGFPVFIPAYIDEDSTGSKDYNELTFQVASYSKSGKRSIPAFVYNEIKDAFVEEPIILDNKSYAIVRLGTGAGTELPKEFTLYQNYPNPFSPRFNKGSTTISFIPSPEAENSEIKIYNIKGQLVREFLNVAPSPSLPVSVTWNGKDENGKQLSNGIYFYKVISGKKSAIKKMVLMH